MINISLIIINFNVYDNLHHAFRRLTGVITDINYEIIVVDNYPQQSSINKITAEFPNVKFFNQPVNLGFAKANNIGAKISNSEYLCFLNPDTLLTEDFISPLIDFIEKNENAGACAPMLVYEDMSYQSSTGFPMGLWSEFLESFYLINIYRKIAGRKYQDKNFEPTNVGWVSGACMVMKKSVFLKVGGFTEDYFLNYEDIDLCKKIEDKGHLNYYFPYLKCIHLDHKSFDKNYELLVFSRYQSKLIYAGFHYSIFVRILSRVINIIGLFLRIINVNFLFNGIERKRRLSGYYKALKLYFGSKT